MEARAKNQDKGGHDLKDNKPETSSWMGFKNLWVHKELFEKGFIVIKTEEDLGNPEDKDSIEGSISNFGFPIKNRQFVIEKDTAKANKSIVKQAQDLLSKLAQFTASPNGKDTAPNNRSVTIVNKNRREEIFLPLLFKREKEPIGLYVYPWLSKSKRNALTDSHNKKDNPSFEFSGFDGFVSAGCILGSSLKGECQNEFSTPLIKHYIKFHAGQKIDRIIFDSKTPNPYEQMLFTQFEKMASLIDKFSSTKQKHLHYHLPYYDYILFGIQLFVHGRITVPALDRLFKAILIKKDEHSEKLKEACEAYGIATTISSPFENIFADIYGSIAENVNPYSKKSIVKDFLHPLGIPETEITPTIDDEEQQKNDEDLVQKCLEKLRTNNFNEEQRRVWDEFLQINDSKEIKTIEDLFKIANTIMIATATRGKNDYKICSLLPLSEKQIQVNYNERYKKLENKNFERNIYPEVVNLTMLDTLIPYTPKNRGQLFYVSECTESLSDLNKIVLPSAYQNVNFFANRNSSQPETIKSEEMPIKLEQILPSYPESEKRQLQTKYPSPSLGASRK